VMSSIVERTTGHPYRIGRESRPGRVSNPPLRRGDGETHSGQRDCFVARWAPRNDSYRGSGIAAAGRHPCDRLRGGEIWSKHMY